MKSYDEIAKSVFERRDKYIAKQKRKKRTIIYTVTSILCCCIVLITSFGLWKSSFFSSNIPILDSSQNVSESSNNYSSADNNQNSSSPGNSSQNNSSLSEPSNNDNNLQNESIPNNSTPSNSNEENSFEPSDDTPSNSDDENPSEPSDDTPSNNNSSNTPVIETNYFIDSIDKINFYSAKKIISEKSLIPIGMSANVFSASNSFFLDNIYLEYPIDRDQIFTTTMVTYFTIELNNEKGFLAQKLGGTGLVEVVVTENNIEDMGQMITFKRSEKYYTCFMNSQVNDPYSNKVSREFSSHKYIDGFNIVKNLEQENYKFTVHYYGSKVVGFECAPFGGTPTNYVADDVRFIEDFCVVLFTRQTFTIDELEVYFRNGNEDKFLRSQKSDC